MNGTYYIGFDVHKQSVSYCVKQASGEIVQEGELRARRGGKGTDGTLHGFIVSLFSPAGSPGCPMFIARSGGFAVVGPGQAGAGGLSAESGSAAYAAQATG